MTDFVEECRREWQRLGVPDRIANEMAADLAADLGEAEAEGVSAEEVIGSGVFDPRSFAASWAAERGVGSAPPEAAPAASEERKTLRPPPVLATLATLAALGLVGAAIALLTSRAESVAVAVRSPVPVPPHLPSGQGPLGVHPGSVHAGAWILLLLLTTAATVLAVWLWSRWARSRPPAALA
jgi:hypothetical protein